MKQTTKILNDVAENPWFIVVGGLSSIAAFLWLLYDKAMGNTESLPTMFQAMLLACALTLLSFGYVYSIKVRSENISLRQIAGTFTSINSIYRDTLQRMFSGGNPAEDPCDLLKEEERTLRSVCQRIQKIYNRVLNRNCMVTVKLVTADNGDNFAETYVRSIDDCERDQPKRLKYKVEIDSNSAFYRALEKRNDGKPSHYFSPDLTKESNYYNSRQDYLRYYKSTIVVPIMGSLNNKESPDLIGFLTVDTLSTNRLNDGYHLHMLVSLASQMYNFMALMRGKYTVFVGLK